MQDEDEACTGYSIWGFQPIYYLLTHVHLDIMPMNVITMSNPGEVQRALCLRQSDWKSVCPPIK